MRTILEAADRGEARETGASMYGLAADTTRRVRVFLDRGEALKAVGLAE